MNKIITRLDFYILPPEKLGFITEKFEQLKTCILNASTDATIMSTILSIIIGNVDANINTITANNMSFYNLQNLINNFLTKLLSSYCNGLLSVAIDP